MRRRSSLVSRLSYLAALLLAGQVHLWAADASRDTLHEIRGAQQVGVLVLAHGGTGRWNRLVTNAVRDAKLRDPVEVAFGMGMHAQDVQAIQRAVNDLQEQRVQRIVVVPLLICSASEVMRQYEYLLGLRDHGSWEDVAPVSLRVPVVMMPPLDDDPVVAEVLLERAQELSQRPQQETVVLVAHGPVSDEDNSRWIEVLARVGQRLRAAGGFRDVVPVTMRDDASEVVQAEATRQMREVVRRHAQTGRALVIPVLLADGGIETKIPKRLNGLSYTYRGRALLPHPKISQWIAQRVEAGLAQARAL